MKTFKKSIHFEITVQLFGDENNLYIYIIVTYMNYYCNGNIKTFNTIPSIT